ncbi:MAG: HAMP domain-containing protein [Gemmatimonadetes bacterium]|nr:HAMP domain-containing protein [Gemmatimonadota bacterium]
MFWRRLPFDRKLLILFLLLALVPSLVLLTSQMRRLGQTIERWENPGVAQSLEASVEILRDAVAESEATNAAVMNAFFDWAGDNPGWSQEEALTVLTNESRARGAIPPDFVTIERETPGRDPQTKTVLAHYAGNGEPVALPTLIAGGLERAALGRDQTLYVRTIPDGGRWIAAVRFPIPDAFRTRYERIVRGYEFYRQLGVFKQYEKGRLLIQTIGIVLLAGLLAVFVSRALSRSLSRPIQNLVAATRRVRAGDFDVRLREAAGDELGVLIANFNDMTRTLHESRDRLARAERVATWATAARRIAHEIKNPLTPITLAIHRIQKRVDSLPEPDRKPARESLASILEEVNSLNALADEFSQFARLPEPRREPLDLNELLRSTVPLYLEGTSIEVEWILDPALPAVSGDRDLLRRALGNLVKNGREAMNGAGTFTVETGRARKERAFLRIADSGPGVHGDERKQIFSPYFTTKSTGSGLGLPLVERIVHDLDGDIALMEEDGFGAVFRIELPLAATDEGRESWPDESS